MGCQFVDVGLLKDITDFQALMFLTHMTITAPCSTEHSDSSKALFYLRAVSRANCCGRWNSQRSLISKWVFDKRRNHMVAGCITNCKRLQTSTPVNHNLCACTSSVLDTWVMFLTRSRTFVNGDLHMSWSVVKQFPCIHFFEQFPPHICPLDQHFAPLVIYVSQKSFWALWGLGGMIHLEFDCWIWSPLAKCRQNLLFATYRALSSEGPPSRKYVDQGHMCLD